MSFVLFDAEEPEGGASRPSDWRLAADTVMGGISRGALESRSVEGRPALVLEGEVSLENGGGFIQMNVDLAGIDVGSFSTLELDLLGDGGRFVVLLKTTDLRRPWQSYRAELDTGRTWTNHQVELAALQPHRTETPLRLAHARRLGLAALGRPGPARLAVARVVFRS